MSPWHNALVARWLLPALRTRLIRVARAATRQAEELRRAGKEIIFTNGA